MSDDSNYVDDWPDDDTPTTAFDEGGDPAWDENDEFDLRRKCELEGE